MEFLFFLIIIFLLLWFRTSTISSIGELQKEIQWLREQLNASGKTVPPKKETIVTPPPVSPQSQSPSQSQSGPPPIPQSPSPSPSQPETPPEPAFIFSKEYSIPPPQPEKVTEKPKNPFFDPPPPRPSFFERHPDLEKFIGENLVNKVGIAILVLGIAFFVKYAIDKNWIHEAGRVAIGVLAGGLLIGIAHRMRKTFKAFSSVLVGGGLSVLYFTIAIAFHQYHLLDQTAAFSIMVVITAFAVALSIVYDRMELAVLAMIGGFTTPFMVSTGEGNFKVLFTYLLILNIGLLVLAYKKRWTLVNILSYFFTILLYGSWLLMKCLDMPDAPYGWALLFGTAFYFVFFLTFILYNIRHGIQFKALETGLLLSNSALYYAAGMGILFYVNKGNYQGLFTALMGVFNFIFAFLLYRRKTTDRNLVYLLVGLVLTFISLAAPIQLEGNHITLFWAAEAVLLLWLSQKSGMQLMKGSAFLVLFLMIVSLAMDWRDIYNSGTDLSLVFNKAFLTALVASVSVFLFQWVLSREKDYLFGIHLSAEEMRLAMKVLLGTLIYLTFLLEIRFHLNHDYTQYYASGLGTGLYNLVFLCTAWIFLRNNPGKTLARAFLLFSGLLLMVHAVQLNYLLVDARLIYLETGSDRFFLFHIPLALLFGFCLYIFNQSWRKASPESIPAAQWLTVAFLVYISSAELNHFGTWFSYEPGRMIPYINKQIAKAGYSVLWGLISFVLMQQGMQRKDRMVRFISLSLFLLTVVKLFAWDIRGISEAGKIIAFISLGILLLIVSFMYQRLKKLLLESDTEKT